RRAGRRRGPTHPRRATAAEPRRPLLRGAGREPPGPGERWSQPMNTSHVLTVARTDLKQLIGARDFWIPMMFLGGLFFVFVPTVLLLSITSLGDVEIVSQISQTLELLPATSQENILGDTDAGRAGY